MAVRDGGYASSSTHLLQPPHTLCHAHLCLPFAWAHKAVEVRKAPIEVRNNTVIAARNARNPRECSDSGPHSCPEASNGAA